jgi:hypothetical protein
MRGTVVLTGFMFAALILGAPAQATPSPSVSPSVDCGPVLTDKPCHNPCDTVQRGDVARRLPCFEVKFTDKCDGTTVVTLGNTAPYTIAVYVVGAETYNVKGGTSKTVTVTPNKGYVLVSAKGHEPWNHRYVKPRDCSSASPTPSVSTVPAGSGQPSLPVTGPVTAFIGVAGLALIGLGAAVLIALRKRRTRFTA